MTEELGLTLDEIRASQEKQASLYANPFQWRSEYIPLIIGAAGVLSIPLIMKLKKGRKKRKKK